MRLTEKFVMQASVDEGMFNPPADDAQDVHSDAINTILQFKDDQQKNMVVAGDTVAPLLSLYLSLYRFLHLSLYRFLHLSLHRFLYLSLYRFLHLSLHLSPLLSLHQTLHKYIKWNFQ
ncbi:hypothetical protein GGF31_003449 [Allomyces arbusculus]|nr:hypothetical protein GGF31_003449 [Allomyces arbusculus]